MENCTVCQGTARIPPRYQGCSFGSFVPLNLSQTRALGEARRFAERFPNAGEGLFLAGGPGIGKTHLAVAILHDLVQRFQDDLLFVDCGSLLVSAEGCGEFWERTKKPALVVLDDFAQPGLDVAGLEDSLLHRVRRRKPTIFTGERIRPEELFADSLPGDASRTETFLKSFHPSVLYRVFSRLKVLPISGQDFRKQHSRAARLFG